MLNQNSVINNLPKIRKLDLNDIPSDATFIGAAGFEDRCFSFLERLIKSNKKLKNVIGIDYLPSNPKNRRDEFKKKGSDVSSQNIVKWITYNRYDPEQFYYDFEEMKPYINQVSNLIVDISGMSKFLIVVLLDLLKNYDNNLLVVYSEAQIYHPIKKVYKLSKDKMLETIPTFLTKDIYKIVTTTSLSSISMQSSPLLVIAFPTFNYKELIALLSEITPQYLVKIEGVPHKGRNIWRLEAVHWLNSQIDNNFLYDIREIIHKKLTTFNYIETVEVLEKIHRKFRYTHKCVISPTGSKFQTVGVFLFKQLYPEVQLVYPVTDDYAKQYSEGCMDIWTINFPEFSNFIRHLKEYRKSKLRSLKKVIESQPK